MDEIFILKKAELNDQNTRKSCLKRHSNLKRFRVHVRYKTIAVTKAIETCEEFNTTHLKCECKP